MEQADKFLISSNRAFIHLFSIYARESSQRLQDDQASHDRPLQASQVKRALADLRGAFQSFDLYLMPVGRQAPGRADAFAEWAAHATSSKVLVLLPTSHNGTKTLDIFDPAPPVQEVAKQPDNWPGMLFWLGTGEATFAPIQQAEAIFIRLKEMLESDAKTLATAINDYNRPAVQERRGRILHLSDLHFGHRDALDREAYLETHLMEIQGDFDRVVITGDLFDDTREEDYRGFFRFWSALQRASSKEPILVLGNHDQRTFGNKLATLGEDYRFLQHLDLSPVVIDGDLQCTFLRFNSSEGGNFARGNISQNQLRDVGTLLDIKRKHHPEIADYPKIALLHHHPYPYAPEEKPVDRRSSSWFRGRESLVELEDSESFLRWCANRDVPLVMHGHKHESRYRAEFIDRTHSAPREITAVGCGTSMGIGGRPQTYNLITWTPDSERWSAQFFSDPGDGSGFHEDKIVLYRGVSL
ncbi:metallophosphoesterase family protein [Streptomyces erythrochromogenes]|uniref:metallophosphoesterase family protein n=1 Tax=Streptomyces erythrochromogenes TaxID=285574 RepID=UPI002254D5E4|nr:metallophosphoesterase [Streptomyces erythrochromogenes]MCX5586790.1 metallophosphoesterase [Streptomyces erythrochromogenes]